MMRGRPPSPLLVALVGSDISSVHSCIVLVSLGRLTAHFIVDICGVEEGGEGDPSCST